MILQTKETEMQTIPVTVVCCLLPRLTFFAACQHQAVWRQPCFGVLATLPGCLQIGVTGLAALLMDALVTQKGFRKKGETLLAQ